MASRISVSLVKISTDAISVLRAYCKDASNLHDAYVLLDRRPGFKVYVERFGKPDENRVCSTPTPYSLSFFLSRRREYEKYSVGNNSPMDSGHFYLLR